VVHLAVDSMDSPMPAGRHLHPSVKQRGSSYVGVLLLVTALGIGMARAGVDLVMQDRREREAALLTIGVQFQRAIASYYDSAPGGQYPSALSDLVEDNRSGVTVRHLRRVYDDPLSSSSEWGLVPGPDGTIAGVFSLAPGKPIKQASFLPGLEGFNDSDTYAQWVFADSRRLTGAGVDEQAAPGQMASGRHQQAAPEKNGL